MTTKIEDIALQALELMVTGQHITAAELGCSDFELKKAVEWIENHGVSVNSCKRSVQ